MAENTDSVFVFLISKVCIVEVILAIIKIMNKGRLDEIMEKGNSLEETMKYQAAFDFYEKCVLAKNRGELIVPVSARDKEFHFQNWCEERLKETGLYYDLKGRNTYPDFSLVNSPEGFEIKGLAYPGRERDFDANSNVPTGLHNGRTIYYVFGRYPADPAPYSENGHAQYPLIDLIVLHGDFLSAYRKYVHENKHVNGFGTYGDIMIRDRKMYVVPTPFALTEGTTGLCTLILPDDSVPPKNFVRVGELVRKESAKVVVGYSFNLTTNELVSVEEENPFAGKEHKFIAYRLLNESEKEVKMSEINK